MTKTELRAFKNSTFTKAQAVANAKMHRDQDHLMAGLYYENGSAEWKGCSVGCFTKDPNGGHDRYPELFGLPTWLAKFQDMMFEQLPQEDKAWWHVSLFSAIKTGQDMEIVLHRFMGHVLTGRLVFDAEKFPQVQAVIEKCASLHDLAASGAMPRSAAYSAACSAHLKLLAEDFLRIVRETPVRAVQS